MAPDQPSTCIRLSLPLTFIAPLLQGFTSFSPDGRLVACAVAYRLIVRDTDHLQIVQIYSCVDAIDGVQWSFDSEYVLCSISKRGVAQVWSVSNSEWHCKIDEGPVGLAHARWSPDGRHVLAAADFNLRLTIWSLLDRSVYYIRFPKFARAGLDFTADGELMALAERRDLKDSVAIVACDGWTPVRSFAVGTQDLADLKWSPRGRVLCAVDTALQYQVLIYTAAGEHLQTYRPYEDALGVKSFAWSPGGEMLAVGSYDERVRILNCVTWQRLAECEHPAEVGGSFAPSAVAWLEPVTEAPPASLEPPEPGSVADLFPVSVSSDFATDRVAGYVARRMPLSVPELKPNLDMANPKVGIGLAQWSFDGRWLATRNDNMPRAIWIWSSESFTVRSVLLQQQGVRAVAWHPSRPLLALCTGTSRVFMWSPAGCHTAPLPPRHQFRVTELSWSPKGDTLLLLDKERFCLCFVGLSDSS
ncbi:hypothetical protein AB1Y20_018725 [Prymnesium parvum]|uniref:WD repeat-containing protein WRAP73 n=1 Tax=Prymnesium parvum TaxID=97485 RepID=A0AB34JSK6_PRYPA